jgi:hypothetical protein
MFETRDINDINAMYTSKIDKTPVLSMNKFFNHNIDNMIRIDIIKDEIKEKTLLGRFLNVILKDNIIDEKNWIKYLCDNLFLLAVLSKDMILIADVVNCGFEIPKNIFSILISKKCFDIKVFNLALIFGAKKENDNTIFESIMKAKCSNNLKFNLLIYLFPRKIE